MGLEIKLNQPFIDMTNTMIEIVKTKGITFENLNFMLVKVPLAETSSIVTAEDFKKRESYKSGVGRVIATPRLINPETDADIRVGDYVVYSHEAKYTVNTPVVNFLFNLNLAEDGKDPIICIRDVDAIAVIRAEVLESGLLKPMLEQK